MLNSKVNFDFSIMKKLWDLAHEKLINIIGRYGIWMNIHGCQLHPKVAIYVVKQLKNDSFRYMLYADHELPTLSPVSIASAKQNQSFFVWPSEREC